MGKSYAPLSTRDQQARRFPLQTFTAETFNTSESDTFNRSQSDTKMTSFSPYDKKYTEPDFMSQQAKPVIKRLTMKYLQRLGSEKAEKATMRHILKNILTGDMYDMYEQRTITGSETKEKRQEWRTWMTTIQEEIWKDLSDGNDTTAVDGMDAPRVASGAAADGMDAPRVASGAAAEGMHAPRVASGAAAHGTGMPAQSEFSKMFDELQKTADELRKASDSMDVVIEDCYDLMKSCRHKHTQVCGLISDLQWQMRKAMDAQDVGAPAMTQVPAPASSSMNRVGAAAVGAAPARLPVNPATGAAVMTQVPAPTFSSADRVGAAAAAAAPADLPVNPTTGAAGGAQECAEAAAAGTAMQTWPDAKASAPSSAPLALGPVRVPVYAPSPRSTDAAAGASSSAKAAPKPKIRDNTKRVAQIFDEMIDLFSVKYRDYQAGTLSRATQEKHIRCYCTKFLSDNMTQLMAQDRNRTRMTWHSVFWLSLLYKFDDQVNKFMAQNPPPYQIKTEKQKIEQRADACKSIFLLATKNFQMKWDIKFTPGGKDDTFEQEIQHISAAFVALGIECDASKIERPIAAPAIVRKRKCESSNHDGIEPTRQAGLEDEHAQKKIVKREKVSNADVTEEENSDTDSVIEID
tara:strand:- start:795 stop:2693 length:1899 start_codon:yes stop_codon:yes gene_type:complete